MPCARSRAWLAVALGAAVACGDGPTPPEPDGLRTLLVHRQDTGENVLLNSDGTDAGTYQPRAGTLVPVAARAPDQLLVLLDGPAVVLGSVGSGELDTILQPAPTSLSLASLSDDGRFVALVSYAPTEGVIVYDRANRRPDTLDFGAVRPVLPAAFSPDNERIALFGLTQLSLTITILHRTDPSRTRSDVVVLSLLDNRPIFGWPRWIEDGIALAFVRVADEGPDTLLVRLVLPDDPDGPVEELYRAVMAPVSDDRPELGIGVASTYAFTSDGRALALGAQPDQAAPGRHAIYLVTPGEGRVRLVRDDPSQFLAFPLFIRER